jgi:ribosomal-protein-alanine N-acetyltransferase
VLGGNSFRSDFHPKGQSGVSDGRNGGEVGLSSGVEVSNDPYGSHIPQFLRAPRAPEDQLGERASLNGATVVAVELETERLRLQPLNMSDADDLFVLHQDPAMLRYFGDGHAYGPEESRTWLEWHVGMWDLEGFSFFSATLKDDGKFVGWVGLNRVLDDPDLEGLTEVGWFIDRRLWGKGLATEGARAAPSHGFTTLGLDRIIARYRTDNVASGRVMEKLGMRHWCEIPNIEVPNTTVTMYEIGANECAGSS